MDTMEKTLDIIIAVINLLKRVFLTVMAGMFGLTALGALTSSIINGSLMGVIGCIGSAFCAVVCWNIMRD